jgi:hypothetical protein
LAEEEAAEAAEKYNQKRASKGAKSRARSKALKTATRAALDAATEAIFDRYRKPAELAAMHRANAAKRRRWTELHPVDPKIAERAEADRLAVLQAEADKEAERRAQFEGPAYEAMKAAKALKSDRQREERLRREHGAER